MPASAFYNLAIHVTVFIHAAGPAADRSGPLVEQICRSDSVLPGRLTFSALRDGTAVYIAVIVQNRALFKMPCGWRNSPN